MKKTILPIVSLCLLAINLSCSKESATPSTPEVVILDPGTPNLSFPANNEPCLESTAVNDVQSTVTFQM